MQVTLDTNVVVSAFLWQGAPRQIWDMACLNRFRLVTNELLMEELDSVLSRRKFADPIRRVSQTCTKLVALYRQSVEMISLPDIRPAILNDVYDNAVLACASKVDALITGDRRHLLALKVYEGTPILAPAEFLRRYADGKL